MPGQSLRSEMVLTFHDIRRLPFIINVADDTPETKNKNPIISSKLKPTLKQEHGLPRLV
jgi:hypothetical protein